MKAVELTDEGALSDCVRKAQKETVVLTKRGRPVAAVVSVDSLDWEDLVVGSDRIFLSLLERSRRHYKAGSGIPLEELRRREGLPPTPARKRATRPHRRSR